MIRDRRSERIFSVCTHTFFIILSLIFIIPLLSIIIISLTDEASITRLGYPFWFRQIDFTAYTYVFQNPKTILNAYKVTIFISAVGTLSYLILASMAAYAISRPGFKFKQAITFYFFFTLLFSGGLVPSYLLFMRTLKLKDTYLALILPSMVNCWYLIMLKTFMSDIPNEILESARIDGAGHASVFVRFILPLSKPALATIGLLTLLDYWNSWTPAMLYIENHDMYPLQYLLQVMLRNILEILRDMMAGVPGAEMYKLPSEGVRMAMCVLAVGPMLFVFPFFQKYFTKGLTVGAVKG